MIRGLINIHDTSSTFAITHMHPAVALLFSLNRKLPLSLHASNLLIILIFSKYFSNRCIIFVFCKYIEIHILLTIDFDSIMIS